MGYYWLRMMDVAQAKLADRTLDQKEVDFYRAKVSQWVFCCAAWETEEDAVARQDVTLSNACPITPLFCSAFLLSGPDWSVLL